MELGVRGNRRGKVMPKGSLSKETLNVQLLAVVLSCAFSTGIRLDERRKGATLLDNHLSELKNARPSSEKLVQANPWRQFVSAATPSEQAKHQQHF